LSTALKNYSGQLRGRSTIVVEDMQVRPDIVVVICDDIGYGDLGCYGSTSIATPRIDEIAARGTRYMHQYSGGPTCTPSRAALLTGRHAPRTGATAVLFPGGEPGLHEAESTIADHLRAGGYVTSAIGKWHVGQMPERGPLAFGFDRYFGLPFSNDMDPLAMYRDEQVVEAQTEPSLLTSRYVKEALSVIQETRDDSPLFLYLAFNMPHYPVAPHPDWEGRSQAGPYGDVCEEIDDGVGRVWDAMSNRGRPFVFVFTSDHGPWFEGSTGGLRGRKFETWEGGVRVPLIVSGTHLRVDEPVVELPTASVDVLPTLLRAAGVVPLLSRPLDGIDLGMSASAEHASERPIWFFDGNQLNAVRAGRWKLHRRRQTWGADRHAQWSLPQLFDLDADPAETYDLARVHLDVVDRLTESCATMERELWGRTATDDPA
jgi:arylsulfatase A-like enzyme